MKHNKQNLDAIIDAAAREIRDEQIDESIINQSATHVWARISQQMTDENSLSATTHLGDSNTMNANNIAEHIIGVLKTILRTLNLSLILILRCRKSTHGPPQHSRFVI